MLLEGRYKVVSKLDHTGGRSSKNVLKKGVKGRGKEVERRKKRVCRKISKPASKVCKNSLKRLKYMLKRLLKRSLRALGALSGDTEGVLIDER